MASRVLLLAVLSGCGPAGPNIIARTDSPADELAVDGDSIYWVSLAGHQVMKAPLVGGAPVVLASGQALPGHLVLDDAAVYWTSGGDGTVMSVSKSGGTPTTLATGQKWPARVVADSQNLYWANRGSSIAQPCLVCVAQDGGVEQMAKTGGAVLELTSMRQFAVGVALHGGDVYWSDLQGLHRVSLGGGVAQDLDSELISAELLVGADGLYVPVNPFWPTRRPHGKCASSSNTSPATGASIPIASMICDPTSSPIS